ncbi:CvpA family protein [candidate division KSB1 bacterium]|nr:MAG: CvpA family protein [candidate division KSB1 bacterium]MBC6951740.1 CvpA family protein [candidate division KSB1 bacterium]MCE7945170.1 CvpA family protein [Chlorobi bacterium CHB1]MDL1879135.1 CvpA family protein [Cytophagia bacterium CHB2]
MRQGGTEVADAERKGFVHFFILAPAPRRHREEDVQIIINFADFIIIGVLAYFIWSGYKGGFYDNLLELIGFYVCLTLTLIVLSYIAKFFNFVLELPPSVSVLLGFIFVFATLTLAYLYFVKWIHKMIEMKVHERFNRITGSLLGAYRGVLMASLLVLGFLLLPIPHLVQPTQARSFFMRKIKIVLPMNYDYVRRLVPGPPGFREALTAAFYRIGPLDEISTRFLDDLPGRPYQKLSSD